MWQVEIECVEMSPWWQRLWRRQESFPLTWLLVCGFCCICAGWSRATYGLDQWAHDSDRAGVWMEQGSFQRADGVKKNGRQTACETQGAKTSQFWIQVSRVWKEDRESMKFYDKKLKVFGCFLQTWPQNCQSDFTQTNHAVHISKCESHMLIKTSIIS